MTRPAPTVTVPAEPTEAMKIAGVHAIDNVQPNDVSMWVTACWSAMITAAPAAPQAAGVGDDELKAIARIIFPESERVKMDREWGGNRNHSRARWNKAIAQAREILALRAQPQARSGEGQ